MRFYRRDKKRQRVSDLVDVVEFLNATCRGRDIKRGLCSVTVLSFSLVLVDGISILKALTIRKGNLLQTIKELVSV